MMLLLFKIILLFAFISPYSRADISNKMIAYTCFTCHEEKSITPKASTKELSKTLLDFKYNYKESTMMGRITKGFSDSELKSISAYLNSLN